MGERVRPFSKGSEFTGWKAFNCQRCVLRWEAGQGYQCDIEAALDYAYMDDGKVRITIGKLLKFDGEHVAEDCPARVLVEVEGG